MFNAVVMAVYARSEDGLKAPLLSDRPEKRATQGEIDYSERDSLVEDLCGNSPEIGGDSLHLSY